MLSLLAGRSIPACWLLRQYPTEQQMTSDWRQFVTAGAVLLACLVLAPEARAQDESSGTGAVSGECRDLRTLVSRVSDGVEWIERRLRTEPDFAEMLRDHRNEISFLAAAIGAIVASSAGGPVAGTATFYVLQRCAVQSTLEDLRQKLAEYMRL